MRTTKHIGVITLKNGEMLEIEFEEYQKILQSFTKSELGKVYISSLRRMIDKTFIVDTQEKWIEDRNAVLVEERPEHLLATKQKINAEPTSPGVIKFIVAGIKLKLKFGTKSQIKVEPDQIDLVNAELKKQGIDFQVY